MGEYLEQQFAAIGVKLNIVSNSWPQFTDRLRNKKSQLFGIAWVADYPDAENMFQLLYGKNVSPGPNNSNFNNKEFNALYEQALKMPPGPKRTEVYKKMRDVFVRELPWIPTVHRIGVTVKHGWVKNLKRNETINGYYKYLRVDQAKKAELKAKL
jgi:ABC-type transport system substrate-binding protein